MENLFNVNQGLQTFADIAALKVPARHTEFVAPAEHTACRGQTGCLERIRKNVFGLLFAIFDHCLVI